MPLMDAFKKKYTANCWCNNCSTHQEVQVPKGVTLAQFVESGTGKCGNCGCNTLVADYEQIDEFRRLVPRNSTQQRVQENVKRPRMRFMKQKFPKSPEQEVQPSVRAPLPRPRPTTAPLPRPRPTTKPMHYQPLPKRPDFEPQKIFKQPPVDYWTGKPIEETEEEGDDENYETN